MAMVEEIKRKSGAPLGNKNGIGYGRPANPGYSNDELIILGNELVDWMEKVDARGLEVVHLSEWYSGIKGIPRAQWKSIIQRDCFLPYYERAISWIGVKILKSKQLPTAYGSRFLGIYFSEIREHEREITEQKIDYELGKKADMNRTIPSNDVLLANLIEGIKALDADNL
jgi:hypothetical protein